MIFVNTQYVLCTVHLTESVTQVGDYPKNNPEMIALKLS